MLKYIMLFFTIAQPAFGNDECEPKKLEVNDSVRICDTVIQITAPLTTSSPYVIGLQSQSNRITNSYMRIILWKDDAACLELNPYSDLIGKNVCITGEENIYRGTRQLIIRDVNYIDSVPQEK